MNTRALMVASSTVLGAAGLAASFAPAELLAALSAPTAEPLPVLIQLLGALYMAFAITNWTAQGHIIGGIYSRPLALGNFMHFMVGALALLKHVTSKGFAAPLVIALVAYSVLALCFGYLVFGGGGAGKAATRKD